MAALRPFTWTDGWTYIQVNGGTEINCHTLQQGLTNSTVHEHNSHCQYIKLLSNYLLAHG